LNIVINSSPVMPRPPSTALVPAVSRALMLLDRLAVRREPMTLARLAADLALPKSSVHGLCNTLMSYGYLRRQDDGGFLIGPRVMGLAEAFVAGTNVAREFNALWSDPATATEETMVLSVLSGAEVVYVAVRNGVRPLGMAFNVGMRLPASLAATGKAMLAFQSAGVVRQLFPTEPLPTLSGKGPRTLTALQRELAAARRRGWSMDDETVRAGVCSVAAPVFDAAGQAVAAIGICVTRAQVATQHGERQRAAVLQAARLLSHRLGGEPPATSHAPPPKRRTPTTKAAHE
jgi:DNA-binding IclR family transcriptional regulator